MNPVHSLLALAGAAPTQDNRLLELHTVLGADVLVAERVEIDEGIAPHPVALEAAGAGKDDAPATGYRIVVYALSVDAHIELKQLIGQPALVELLTSHSRTAWRPWHGHITRAAMVGSDGGLARYRMVIEPWFGFLAHRRGSRVFLGQTVRQIVDEVFADYQVQGRLAPAWRWEIADETVYPARSLCTQYQENDLQFVQRLLREEGLFHWFEHTGAARDPSLGVHTLVIADHNGAFTPNAQADVRYTQSSVALKEDSLTRWQRTARLQTSAVQLASLDYRSLGLREAAQTGVGRVIPELLLDDIPGAYAYEDSAQGERLALRQMQAIDALRFQVRAQASVRTTAPGSTFTLRDHPVHDGSDDARDRFVTLRVRHRARNNLQADAKAAVAQAPDLVAAPTERPGLANDSTEPLYTCHLVAQPAAITVRSVPLDEDGQPDPRLHPRPTIRGVQTAVVVGLGEPVHTDRDHRIKLQFHWQRGGRGSHRLDAPANDNAPASDASGTWVRVAESVAGANWGSHFVPRLGQEVLVSFIEGDIDRPVVIGSLYNGSGQADAQGNRVSGGAATATGNAYAWFPGDAAQGELQAHRHAAVLAGYKTQELASSQSGAGGYNQLVFDDTPGGNRIELSTTTERTRLQLGHLLNQSDNQRLQPRGHGIDLATAAWGAVRAGSGLLLSAHGRAGSQNGGHQTDSREPQAALEQAGELMRTLAESAQKQNAQLSQEQPPDKLAAAVSAMKTNESLVILERWSGAAAPAGPTSERSGANEVPAPPSPVVVAPVEPHAPTASTVPPAAAASGFSGRDQWLESVKRDNAAYYDQYRGSVVGDLAANAGTLFSNAGIGIAKGANALASLVTDGEHRSQVADAIGHAVSNPGEAAAAIEKGTTGWIAKPLVEQLQDVGELGVEVLASGGTALLARKLVGDAAQKAGSIRNVNTVGGAMNCVNCAVATDATLAGRAASALPGGPYRITVLETYFGRKFGPASTASQISDEISAAGQGARGIVFGSRASGVGHVFNVVNQGGAVRFLDGQTGGAASLDGYQAFQLLRTN